MSRFPKNGSNFRSLSEHIIRFPSSFDVCWAGPSPLLTGFCFGSTDGKIWFTDEDGQPLASPEKGPLAPAKGSTSGEAINGVARNGTWIGVSTRADVNFFPLPGTPELDGRYVTVPYGAHSVLTAANGYFVAPLGQNGIMAAQASFGDSVSHAQVYSSSDPDMYVYRLTILGLQSGGEVIACASRLGGIVAGELDANSRKLNLKIATCPGLDIVDVCSLGPDPGCLAVAALARDGTLILFQDVLKTERPLTMKFKSVQGVAYRLLCSHGDIYVLTSKGLFVLGELAARFLRDELTGSTHTPLGRALMGTVDANLVDNRWFLVVKMNEVYRYDMKAIHRDILQHLVDPEVRVVHMIDSKEWNKKAAVFDRAA